MGKASRTKWERREKWPDERKENLRFGGGWVYWLAVQDIATRNAKVIARALSNLYPSKENAK